MIAGVSRREARPCADGVSIPSKVLLEPWLGTTRARDVIANSSPCRRSAAACGVVTAEPFVSFRSQPDAREKRLQATPKSATPFSRSLSRERGFVGFSSVLSRGPPAARALCLRTRLTHAAGCAQPTALHRACACVVRPHGHASTKARVVHPLPAQPRAPRRIAAGRTRRGTHILEGVRVQQAEGALSAALCPASGPTPLQDLLDQK